jgi:hypothetical protein
MLGASRRCRNESYICLRHRAVCRSRRRG